MSAKHDQIINWLFSTKAIQVAQPDQPFWYTSGTLGPYYINTHYLYGDKASAEILLEAIEKGINEPLILPAELAERSNSQYEHNEIFSCLMDIVADSIKNYQFDIISGGERRDFFFSVQAAILLNKPHLSILKDGRSLISEPGSFKTAWTEGKELAGLKVFHIADLVTEASSYLRTWIPTVRSLGCKMDHTLSIVDRKQGAEQVLKLEGTELHSLINIDSSLFQRAVEGNLMTKDQQDQISIFMQDPRDFMKTFLKKNPGFLDSQIAAGGKAAQRARLCLEQGYGKAD